MAGKIPPAFLKAEKGDDGDDDDKRKKPIGGKGGKGLAPPFIKGGGKGGRGMKSCGHPTGTKCNH